MGGYSDIILAWFSSHGKYSINPVLFSCSLKYPFLYREINIKVVYFGKAKKNVTGTEKAEKVALSDPAIGGKALLNSVSSANSLC